MSTLKSCGTETVTVIKNPFGPYRKSIFPSTSMQNFSQNGHMTMTENDVKENNPVFVEKSFSSVTYIHKVVAPNPLRFFGVFEVGEKTGVGSKFISITVLDIGFLLSFK